MTDLSDQHALITGGGSGIGLACAQAFAADVSNEQSIGDAIAAADKAMPLSIIVANAGTGSAGSLLNMEAAEWDRVLQTNLNGTFYTFKHGGQALVRNGGGAMCAISSIAGIRTHKLMSAYCTSKAAIDALVRNSADELGARGVRVNSVCPGLVTTELSAGLHQSDAMREDYLACMPLHRVGEADDIAQAVAFLCGPQSSWITGAVLPVDGGHHLRRGPNIELLTQDAD